MRGRSTLRVSSINRCHDEELCLNTVAVARRYVGEADTGVDEAREQGQL